MDIALLSIMIIIRSPEAIIFDGTKLDDRTDYEYNSSGQLVKLQYYSVNSSSGTVTKSQYSTFGRIVFIIILVYPSGG